MPGDASRQIAVLQTVGADDCMTIVELADRTGLTRRQISMGATGLITRGLLERVETGCFRLTEAGKVARDSGARLKCGAREPLNQKLRRPRRTTKRDLLWRALRIRGKATIGELLELAGIDEEAGYNNALRFIGALECAGYVRRLKARTRGTALTSNGFLRFQLLRDTGAKAPAVRLRTGEIYDRNTGETHKIERRP